MKNKVSLMTIEKCLEEAVPEAYGEAVKTSRPRGPLWRRVSRRLGRILKGG